jgi:CRISPR system Cascade subunit CasB
MAKNEEKKKIHYQVLKNESDRENLQKWWQKLDDNRGERAELKRAATPLEACASKAFFKLRNVIPNEIRPETVAMIAGVLSVVKNDTGEKSFGKDGLSFAQQLAKPVDGEKSPLSESRFQKLLKCRTQDDFYTQIRRAVQILKGKVNICSLAEGIIQWSNEHSENEIKTGSHTLKFQWSTDYYEMFLNQKGNN